MGGSIERFLQKTEPSPEKAPKSEFARWLDEDDVQERLSAADTATRGIAPPQAAKVLSLSKQTALPADLVERNLELVTEEARKDSLDTEAFRKEYPNVAKWLAQQPQHLALARRDLDRLGYVERQVKNIGDQFKRNQRTMELARIGNRVMWGKHTDDDRKRQRELERELGEVQPDYGFRRRVEQVPGYAAGQIPVIAKGLKGGIKGGIMGGVVGAGTALVLGQAGPQAATPEEIVTVPTFALRGAAVGGKVGLAVENGATEAELAYLDYEKIRDDNGLPLDRETMLGAAIIVGTVNGLLETFSLKKMAKNIPGIRSLGREAVKRALMAQTTQQAFARYAKSVAEAMVVEGTTEAVQSLMKNAAGEFAQMKQDKSIETLSPFGILDRLFGQHLTEAVGEAEAGALAGGGISAVAGATAIPGDLRRARDAEKNAEFFHGLGEAMSEAEIVKLAPDKAEEMIESLTRNGPVEKFYTPAEVWQEYWQSQELDPAEVAEQLIGSREEYEQALRTGGDLAIPVGKYATYLAPTPHNAFFERELKATPDAMSAREAEEFAERMDEEARRSEEPAESVADYRETPGARELAHAVKRGEPDALAQMAREMAPRIPEGAVLVPIPSRTGRATTTLALAEAIAAQTGATVADILEGPERESVYERKKAGQPVPVDMLGFRLRGEVPSGRIIAIDNVLATGTTAEAVTRVLPNARVFVHSIDRGKTGDERAGQIQREMRSQLQSAGFSPEQAETQATLYREFFATQGARMGVDPMELFQRFNLSVERPGIQGPPLDVRTMPLEELARRAMEMRAGIQETEAERQAVQAEAGTLVTESPYAIPPEKRDIARTNEAGQLLYARGEKALPGKELPKVSTEGLIEEIAYLLEQQELDSRVAVPSVIERVSEPYYKPWVGMKGAAIMASGRNQQRKKRIEAAEAELAKRGIEDANERIFARMMGRSPEEVGDASFDFSLEQAAYHGSPHIFDKFSLTKIGTGEGAQAYGWGLYFAGKKEIAEYYRKNLSQDKIRAIRPDGVGIPLHHFRTEIQDTIEVDDPTLSPREIRRAVDSVVNGILDGDSLEDFERFLLKNHDAENRDALLAAVQEAKRYTFQRNPGRLYKVEIPDDDTFLLWDKPLSEQPEKVKEALAKGWLAHPEAHEKMMGSWIYEQTARGMGREDMHGDRGNEEAASRKLASLGINGIKYLDASSRGRPKFDPAYLVAANSFYQSGASFDEAMTGLQKAYKGAPIAELDAAARQAYRMEPKESFNYVVFDDELVEIVEYEQRKQGTPRGRIKIGNQSIAIELLKDADLSTFLHETGHFFLEALNDLSSAPNADGDIVADMETIRKWVGAAPGEAFTREHHETFARGFERYLMEGKAPSAALRTAFQRFRAWLVFVYRSLLNLNVELTPEVRSVFDRMLATETEIAAAQAEQVMVPLFADPKAVGLTEEQAASYTRQIQEARATAEEELSSRLIADYQREVSEQWKAERVKVREEVAQEVNAEPVSLAYSVLGRGRLPDGTEIPEALAAPIRDEAGKLPKLSKQALEAEYAVRPEYQNLLKRLPRPYVYSKAGGIHPDQAADLFGFRSGDELIQALLVAEEPRRRIERLADERMRERHSDELLSPEEVTQEAMKAVHNEKRAAVLERELQILAAQALPTVKGLVRRLSRRIPPSEAVRAEAEAIIARRRIRDVQPITYQRAEQKAARAAIQAFTKGDIELAFEEKLRERYNLELYRAATNAREEVEGVVRNMQRFDKRSVRERLGKAGADYLDQIDALRERYDFARGLSRAQVEKRKSLLRFVEEQKALGIEITVPPSIIEEAGRTHYTDLSVEELRGLDAAVRQIEHLAGLKNRLLQAQRAREMEEARSDIVSSIAAYHDISARPEERVPTFGQQLAKVAKIGLAEHTRMEFLFEALDGGKAQGPVWQYFFKPFTEAENVENEYRRKDAQALKEIFGRYTKKERNAWFTDRINIREATTPNSSPTFTKQHLLSIALNWGNAYNRQALMEGYGWNEAQVQRILERLDARDWETVQAIWDHINSYWPEAAALEREITGLAPEKVEATEVVTRFGTYKGGYYPIVFDRELSTRQAALDEAADVSEMFGGLAARAMTKHGHLKERTNTGGKPLLLDLTVIPRHLSQVTHDLAFRRAVIDVSRLIRDPQIESAIERAVGKELFRQLGPWVKAIAGDRPKEYSSWLAAAASRARAGATVVSLGINVVSSLMQTLGFSTTVNQIGPRYAMKGVREAFATSPNLFKLVQEDGFIGARSKMMRDRMQNYDRDVRDYGRKLSNIGGDQATWFVLIGYMDLAVSVPTWLGAYRKAMDGGLENVDKGDEAKAIDYADSVIRQTQSAGAAKDLASIQRGHELQRLFTMFYSSLSIVFNQFERSRRQYTQDHNVPRLLASLTLLWFVPALLEDVIRGRMPDEEDDESWLGWLVGNLASYPMATVIGVRDLANAIERKLTTGRTEFTASPAFEAGRAITGAVVAGVKAVLPDEEVTRADLKDAVLAVGYVFRLPSRQVWRSAEVIHDWWTGDYEPESVVEGVESVVRGRSRR